MGYGIKLEVWGDYALFTRPEMKVERVSYDVITPSAARGIIEAIYWKPAIRWVIDKIYIYNPIEFTNIRRNEIGSKASSTKAKSAMLGKNDAPMFIDTTKDRQQRAAMVLKNVHYIIEAHFELTDKKGESDTVEKHYNIALRRMRNGQCYHMPCFGCREFPANFRIIEDDVPSPIKLTKDLGWMLYDMDYSDLENIDPKFFKAQIENGVLDLKDVYKVG